MNLLINTHLITPWVQIPLVCNQIVEIVGDMQHCVPGSSGSAVTQIGGNVSNSFGINANQHVCSVKICKCHSM